MKNSIKYKSRFRILNSRKISLLVSTLLCSNMAFADIQTVSTSVISKYMIGDGDGLVVNSNASISVTGDNSVENTGVVTSIINNGIISSDNDHDAIYIHNNNSGSITNNGTINGGEDGIRIDTTTINGNITNNGTINGDEYGISIYNTTINGNITNNEKISTIQNDLMDITDTTITGQIINNGTLEGEGEGLN